MSWQQGHLNSATAVSMAKVEAAAPKDSNPTFTNLLAEMKALHARKAADYAAVEDPYSNFKIAGQLGAMFSDPVDIAFAVLIGVKLARLAELKGKGKVPQNEGISDSHLDLSVYSALWASFERSRS